MSKKQSKEELLLQLSTILLEPYIKLHIDKIAEIRLALLDYTTDVEELNISNKIREKIQDEAEEAWNRAGRRGAILIATGVGKTKIAINIIGKLIQSHLLTQTVISVPTEKLRDEGWRDEFIKWNYHTLIDSVSIYKTCYASLNRIKNWTINLTILDEGHNITEENSEYFNNNEINDILVLTATRPTDQRKIDIFRKLGIQPVYELKLDEAVKLGIVAPYDITVIEIPLNETEKYIKVTKKATILKTEKEAYNYYTRMTIVSKNPFSRINRMRFIYDCNSKGYAAKRLLDYKIPKDLRKIIFCGSKAQAISISPYRFFSKPTIKPNEVVKDSQKYAQYKYLMDNYQGSDSLNKFVSGEIDEIACVTALNEGHNLGQIDIALVVQLNSKQLHTIQRIGRILRYYVGHVGKIIILVLKNTIDEEWCEKALRGLDRSKIRRISLEDIRTGKEQLFINNQNNQDGKRAENVSITDLQRLESN